MKSSSSLPPCARALAGPPVELQRSSAVVSTGMMKMKALQSDGVSVEESERVKVQKARSWPNSPNFEANLQTAKVDAPPPCFFVLVDVEILQRLICLHC